MCITAPHDDSRPCHWVTGCSCRGPVVFEVLGLEGERSGNSSAWGNNGRYKNTGEAEGKRGFPGTVHRRTVDVGKRRCEFEIYFGREKYCYVSGVSKFV